MSSNNPLTLTPLSLINSMILYSSLGSSIEQEEILAACFRCDLSPDMAPKILIRS